MNTQNEILKERFDKHANAMMDLIHENTRAQKRIKFLKGNSLMQKLYLCIMPVALVASIFFPVVAIITLVGTSCFTYIAKDGSFKANEKQIKYLENLIEENKEKISYHNDKMDLTWDRLKQSEKQLEENSKKANAKYNKKSTLTISENTNTSKEDDELTR